jgi:hypothetical protein
MTNMDTDNYRYDLEETPDQLEREEREPLAFWEAKQRELVTSVVDYNLSTLADLVENNDIDLSPKYQRRYRWDGERQSKLIESFLMNVPVPPVFLNEDAYGQYSVIDGKQRLNAIRNFLRGTLTLKGLEIFSDINDHTFDDLPSRLQTIIRTRPTLRAVIVLRQSDTDIKFEVFRRLNTGGVKLNAHEIRNSVYPGPLNDLILDLSVDKRFHRLLGIKNPDKSAIYREMRDAEFVLRFFAFRNTWQDFSGGIRRRMDSFMEHNQRPSVTDLDEMKGDFIATLDGVEAAFDDHSFQRWVPERQQWRQQVLASLYDAQMFAFRGFPADRIAARSDKLVEAFKLLFSNDEFRKSIDAATNTPAYFKNRISIVRSMLEKILR